MRIINAYFGKKIAFLHPAKDYPKKVSIYKKAEYKFETRFPPRERLYDYIQLKKIQEEKKDVVLFIMFNLNKERNINPLLINRDDTKDCIKNCYN